jgi:hypothetical protein
MTPTAPDDPDKPRDLRDTTVDPMRLLNNPLLTVRF